MTRQVRKTDIEKVLPILAPVLGDKLARAIIEFRDDVKKEPLTEYAAELQVKEYLKCGDPVAAAEMQILRSWRAIKVSWFQNEIRKDDQSRERNPVPPLTPYQQRHQDAINAFTRDTSKTHEQFAGDTIDLEQRDFRAH